MLLALLLVSAPADAKDLRSRLGIGLHEQFGSVTALSARYGLPTGKPTSNVQIEVDLGADLASTMDPKFFAGGRLLFSVVAEDNMNLYLGAGAGYVVDGPAGVVRLQPVAGAEFFFFGLENLGFSVEWGVNVDLGSAWAVQTIGSSPGVAAHYYF